MSFTEDLLTGLAQLLAAAGVGDWSGSALPASGAQVRPLITLVTLPQAPERIICLTDYPVADDARLSDGVVGVQVRIRGDASPLTVRRDADAVRYALHGLGNTTLPNGVRIVQCYRQSYVALGPDALGREERSDNYYVGVNQLAANTEV